MHRDNGLHRYQRQSAPPADLGDLAAQSGISVDLPGEFVSNSALGGPRAEVIAVFTPTTSAGNPAGYRTTAKWLPPLA